MNRDKAVSELIYRSCLLLDELDFSGYLELCSPSFQYKVTAFSPELRKNMTWKDENKEEMKRHFELIPKHFRESASLSRYPTVYTISYSDDGKQATVLSGLQIFKTKLDGGETRLYGVARMQDVLEVDGEQPRLLSREIKMETRQLGISSQIPF